MTREERLEKIRTEYMLTKVDDEVTCYEDTVKYLKAEASDMAYSYRHVVNSIWHDTFELYKTRALNSLFGMFGFEEESEEYLVKDIEALRLFGNSIGVYEFLYQRLLASVTEDNWHDIYVLGEFMGDKYLQTDNYYTRVIQSIEVSYEGFMCVAGGEDETLLFREVFDEALEKILAREKKKQKNRGICYDKGRKIRKN